MANDWQEVPVDDWQEVPTATPPKPVQRKSLADMQRDFAKNEGTPKTAKQYGTDPKELQREFASRQGTAQTARQYGVGSEEIDGVPQWGREHPNLYAFAKTVSGGIDLGKPTDAPASIADFAARVVPESAVKTAASAVTAPYHMIKNVTDPMVEYAFSLGNPSSGNSLAKGIDRGIGENVKSVADFMAAPLGFKRGASGDVDWSTDNAVNQWATDPVGSALALVPTLKLAKEGIPAVSDFAVDGTRKAANAIGIPKVLDATANKLYDMTLKQGTTLKPEIRAQNLEAGLEGQYLPNNKGVDKLAGDIHATEQKLGAGIAAGDAAKVTGTLDRAIANVEALREQAKRSANPERNLALIDAEIERLRGNPTQSPTGDIPIGELQKMKVEQGRQVKYQQKMNQAVDPFQASIDKARIRGLREELESRLADSFPELADTNRQLGRMYQLQDVLERAANRIENNQGIGIGLPIKGGSGGVMGGMIGGPAGAAIGSGIGTLIGIIEHPAVAPRIALALRRAVKGLSKEEANTIVNNRLGGLKDGLIQREQTVLDSESLPKVSNSNLGDVIPEGYQQTYDWSGKPPAPEPVANPEALPPRPLATNLGDELRPNDYAPVHGWEGKQPAPVVANPEALPPRQSSQMPQVSEQGGRIVPQVEAMTPRVPEGFNPEVMVGNESQLGDRLAPQPHPLRNVPENNGNGGGQGSPVAGLSEAVDISVSPQMVAEPASPAAHTWQSYLAAHMSRAMKETGDHGKAMKLLGEEWRKDGSKDPLGIRSIIDKLKDERGLVGRDIGSAQPTKWHNLGAEERKKHYDPDKIMGNGPFEVWDRYENRPMTFDSRESYENTLNNTLYPISAPLGNERMWYRKGSPPESGFSHNYSEGRSEQGVSVYGHPNEANVFFEDRDTYQGLGRQVGWGSDGEPLVVVTGKWSKMPARKGGKK